MSRTFQRADPLTAGAVLQIAAVLEGGGLAGIALGASGVGFWVAMAADSYLEGEDR